MSTRYPKSLDCSSALLSQSKSVYIYGMRASVLARTEEIDRGLDGTRVSPRSHNLITRLLLTAPLAIALPTTTSAANIAFQCKVENFINPFVDRTNKNSVDFDKLQQKHASSKELAVVIRGNEVTVFGANYPGPMSMRIAQHGTEENGWSFVKLVDGLASSPVHFLKIRSFKSAGKTDARGTVRYPFAYVMDGETYYGTCVQQ